MKGSPNIANICYMERGGDLMIEDGLYWVVTRYLCAGFIVVGGKVKVHNCAPILRKRLVYWMTKAKRISN